MTQADFTIANQTFPNTRTELNTSLQALATNSAGNSAPSTTFPSQWWFDSDHNTLYMRNKDNDAWVRILEIGATSDETQRFGENIYVDSDGKVLIGDSASHTTDLFQIETPASGGGHGIQIRRNDANNDQQIGTISFGNNTDTDLAQILVRTDNDSNSGDSGALTFKTQPTGGASTERMRIDSKGNVGIGILPESGQGSNSQGLYVGTHSSLTSNGAYESVNLSENAYLATAASDAWKYRDTSHAATHEMKAGVHTLKVTASGSADAAITWTTGFEVLNDGKARAKNGLLFGTDTASANALDDYEEGTFTYAINGSNSGNLVLRSGYARGEYVKIGNLVHIDLRFETSSDNSISGNLQWSLPFTKANANASDAGNSTTVGYIRDNSLNNNARTGVYLVGQSEAYAQLLFSREGAVNSTVELANDANTDGVMEGNISITYRTT